MNSAGNDVVALGNINAERTVQHRFYSKFSTPAEQEIYSGSALSAALSFGQFIWLLWSAKEAAYKYWKRLYPQLTFAPVKFTVNNVSIELSKAQPAYTGRVKFQDEYLYFQSSVTGHYIHTVVDAKEHFSFTHWGILKIEYHHYEAQSAAARLFALRKLSSLLKLTGLKVIRHPLGYPELWLNNEALPVPLSLSHDGFFTAFSCNLTGHNFRKIAIPAASDLLKL